MARPLTTIKSPGCMGPQIHSRADAGCPTPAHPDSLYFILQLQSIALAARRARDLPLERVVRELFRGFACLYPDSPHCMHQLLTKQGCNHYVRRLAVAHGSGDGGSNRCCDQSLSTAIAATCCPLHCLSSDCCLLSLPPDAAGRTYATLLPLQ